ncbi:MAG: hypothetical protein SV760_00955, partial [Halobacteria archaeon]|nr:hypothetical protein [Halobacteria archaeon]
MSSPEQISDYGGEIKADSYLERLKQVLEFKGGVILASMLILAVFRGIAPSFENWVLLGSIFVIALTAAVAYRGKVPLVGDEADAVGLGILAVALGGVVLEAVGVQQGWVYPLLASLFVLGTVAYDYWKESTPAEGEWEEEPRKPEVLKVDLVGLVVAELLLSYALLMAGGWVEFAQSPIFIGIAFYFASSVFAIAAGYTVITREIDESEERNEFHEFLIDSLIDIQEIEDER